MHAPITFAEGYGELSAHPYGILKGVVDGQCFVKGSWGACASWCPCGRLKLTPPGVAVAVAGGGGLTGPLPPGIRGCSASRPPSFTGVDDTPSVI